MRVVSGEARGRRLLAPKSQGVTRPMSDKIKSALFSSLASLDVDYERVLDLYAGSGGVGIEAISRGADWCDFVDRDIDAVRAIKGNLESTGLADRGAVHQMTIEAAISRFQKPYDLVIVDPPYADPDIIDNLAALSRSRAVQDGTIVAIGHSPRVTLPETIGMLQQLRQRCHGDSCFAIYDCVLEPSGEEASQGE